MKFYLLAMSYPRLASLQIFIKYGAMLISLKRITIAAFVVYCVLTCYTAYILIIKNNSRDNTSYQKKWSIPDDGEDWNPWGEEFEREQNLQNSFIVQKPQVKWWNNHSLDFGKQFHKSKLDSTFQPTTIYNVEIWGKAAIGLYLWEHVFGGKLENKMDGVWSYGFKRFDNIKLKFRTGPGVITTKAPIDVQYLILILNGRSDEKKSFAKVWLDYLPQFHQLRNVAVILLGSEQCHNDWLFPYTTIGGGLINVTYIVYDSPFVDNVNFFQWPLGVATYRGFPKVDPKKLDLEAPRPYVCNFLGTIYPHSSREELVDVVQKHNLSQFCFVRARQEWHPKETKNSLNTYIQSLRLSDLTLNPLGMNTECYRIYEAMSFGSVPVVEDVMTSGVCGDSKAMPAKAPLRLLKSLNAPIIYIKKWSELPRLISFELKLTHQEKVARRLEVIQWYENFKIHLRDQILTMLKEQFFRKNR